MGLSALLISYTELVVVDVILQLMELSASSNTESLICAKLRVILLLQLHVCPVLILPVTLGELVKHVLHQNMRN